MGIKKMHLPGAGAILGGHRLTADLCGRRAAPSGVGIFRAREIVAPQIRNRCAHRGAHAIARAHRALKLTERRRRRCMTPIAEIKRSARALRRARAFAATRSRLARRCKQGQTQGEENVSHGYRDAPQLFSKAATGAARPASTTTYHS